MWASSKAGVASVASKLAYPLPLIKRKERKKKKH
jgi:hypothetical protein